jgi:hypothetical protein
MRIRNLSDPGFGIEKFGSGINSPIRIHKTAEDYDKNCTFGVFSKALFPE